MPSTAKRELTDKQLEIVMRLANGERYQEIADAMFISYSVVTKEIRSAQSRVNATTVAHLVSITIAGGQLEWVEEHGTRAIAGNSATP